MTDSWLAFLGQIRRGLDRTYAATAFRRWTTGMRNVDSREMGNTSGPLCPSGFLDDSTGRGFVRRARQPLGNGEADLDQSLGGWGNWDLWYKWYATWKAGRKRTIGIHRVPLNLWPNTRLSMCEAGLYGWARTTIYQWKEKLQGTCKMNNNWSL